jgi:hypothetical protein
MKYSTDKLFFFSLLIGSLNAFGAPTWKKITAASPVLFCPSNYVLVPALSPYTTRDFCIMKYEAKLDAYGAVVSTATGTPAVGNNTGTVMTGAMGRIACQALGAKYDLISNYQWQTVARNIAGVTANWDSGHTSLNIGNSNGVTAVTLAASTDDNQPCSGIAAATPCSASVWHTNRRTHILSNGNVVWDLSGNVQEFTTANNTATAGATGQIASLQAGDVRQINYGSATADICASYASSPYCGMGSGMFTVAATGCRFAVVRGSKFDDGSGDPGIFKTVLGDCFDWDNSRTGFRCVYAP